MEDAPHGSLQHDCRDPLLPYLAYGLEVRSCLPLPALAGQGSTADVLVRFAPLQEVAAELRRQGCDTRVTGDEIHVLLPDVGTFLVRDGREILVDPEPAAAGRMIARAIIGPIMAALLQQRGALVLHASAVEMDGAAVAFLGNCGAGKSTIAAALHRAGHGFLSDDVVAVLQNGGAPRVSPGVPQMKLWPDAVTAIGKDPEELARIDPQFAKRACTVTEGFRAEAPIPLACVFVLCRGARLAVEPLCTREAFLEVLTHSYGVHWLHQVAARETFRARSELARRVPVRRLVCPDRLDRLPDAVRTVEECRESR